MRPLWILPFLLACGPRSSLGDAGAGLDAGPRDALPFVPQMVLARFVIDGDTIIVEAGADLKTPDRMPLDQETVRLIGVSAPEVAHDGVPEECFGDEAKAFTEDAIGGKIVELSYDHQNGYRGNFGRLLAYVKRSGNIVNEDLIRTGHAEAFRQFPHPERSRYIALEQDAKNADLGLWADCK